MPPRIRFFVRRLLQAVPVIIGIVILNFLLLHLAPGDAVDVLAGEAGYATPEYMATLRAKFGLDRPMHAQLVLYLKNILTFDLGYSFRHGMPVAELILDRLAPTALLMGTAFVLAVVVGTTLGVMASRYPNTWRDSAITGFALLCYAAPLFWVGLMLIIVFSIKLDLLPISGMENIVAFNTGIDYVIDVAHHLILPAVTLSLFYLAVYTRMARASILEVSRLDYVTMARAKGLKERQVVYKHILKNALLPVVTMAGVQMAGMLGGSVIVESVFGWPGLGLMAFNAFFARDLNLLLGIFFLSSMLVLVVNIMVDMIYSLLDPRIEIR